MVKGSQRYKIPTRNKCYRDVYRTENTVNNMVISVIVVHMVIRLIVVITY